METLGSEPGGAVEVSMNIFRRIEADPARYFTPDEVEKSKRYQRPLTRLGLLSSLVTFLAMVALVGWRAGPRLIDARGLGAWPLQVLVIAVAITAVIAVAGLPISYYRTFVHEKKWGFSTQTVPRWISDQVKNLFIGAIVTSALLLALWWVIRTTDLWWFFGALVLILLTALLVFLAPIVIFPLFNKFTPAQDPELRDRLREVARSGGIDLSDVLVMDASKRTRHDNAFFTGLGKTKRVVIFDNMLTWDRDLVDIVVAHEAGHWKHRHLIRSLLTGTASALVIFALLKFVMSWETALDWAGVNHVRDPAAAPLFALAFGVISLLTHLPERWFSRAQERQADLFALNLIGNPGAFNRAFRQLSEKDLPDLAPSWWKRINLSHPPVAERLAMSEAWPGARGDSSSESA